jgi:hypothetical protein
MRSPLAKKVGHTFEKKEKFGRILFGRFVGQKKCCDGRFVGRHTL